MEELRTGLVGAGIGTSLSPALHEQEGRAHHLSLSYVLHDTDHDHRPLDRILREAAREGFLGLNVTHPYKQAVVPLLDDLSPSATSMGAVNTVRFTEGRMTGHNTDGPGYTDAFARRMPGADLGLVVQCGAGGAGAAVANAQLSFGVQRLVVHDPDPTRRAELVHALRARFGPSRVGDSGGDAETVISKATGLVNASPMGMAAHPGMPVPADVLHAGLWVSEVVYMPVETMLLREARARGLRTLSGVHMCVHQAAKAFEIFTDREPDVDRMLAHLSLLLDSPTTPPTRQNLWG